MYLESTEKKLKIGNGFPQTSQSHKTLYVIMKEETQKNPIKYEYLIGFDDFNGESNPEICNSKRQDKNKIDYTGLVARAYSRK